jgi:Coenzyme PQQ synthesis protein D (PqqD)
VSAVTKRSVRKRGMRERFRHSAGVHVRKVDGEIFLAARGVGTIHHLDRMAAAVWDALIQPRTAGHLIELFQAAFPDAPRTRIAKDVAELLAFLERNKLIVRVGKTGKGPS